MLRRFSIGLTFALLGCSVDPRAHEVASAEPPVVSLEEPLARAPEAAVPASTAIEASKPALDSVPAPPCPSGFRCDEGALARSPAPTVTEVRVEKASHRMYLLSHDTIVKTYSVAIGWGGAGPKQREGDAVTPVGTYEITGKLDKSPWHILLGVSYPNYEDVKRFAKLKAERKIPLDSNIGFGIAIHGRRADMKDGEHKKQDWTLGCVAVDNAEIEEIARVVRPRTKVTIVD